ncbi:MAG: hypothetical protein JKX72_03645 [Robiginitomaculum sp.]|nr:hypothetical protein [Robiginitomaculum sp.]
MQNTRTALINILNAEQVEPSGPAASMCEKIKARHQGRVQALLYYGSSLRAMNDPSKMLDFYVIIDSYFKTHKNPIRAVLNALIPPAVYYLENENPDGSLSTCKYSVMSLTAFERRTTKKAFLSTTWGRFSQPCVLLFPKDKTIHSRIQNARVNAILHMTSLTQPLVTTPISAVHFWAKGFLQSYRTELRPESSDSRSQEIVARYQDRYDKIMNILYGPANAQGEYSFPQSSRLKAVACKWGWGLRRVLGKPMNAVRVLNSAFTFSGGIDYVLHKVKSHSGVTLEISEGQRRHPVLWSPVLAWKLYQRGAFK